MKNTNLRERNTNYYVHPHSRGWAVECENNSPVTFSYRDKQKAINTAKSLAQKHHSDVVIQKTDGSVENKLSYH